MLFGPPTNSTDTSPDGPDDAELQTIFILVIFASIGLEVLLRWAPHFDEWNPYIFSSEGHSGKLPVILSVIILTLWGFIFGIGAN